MASTTSSNSGVHSESASSQSQPPIKEEQDVSSENVVTEKLKKESLKDAFEDMDNLENKEKYEKYEADYTRYLKAKYFSDKTIFGGNIYDVKMTSDGQTIKASRLPPYQSFADPASFHALLTSVSKPEEETTDETSNGKQTTSKNSN